MGIAVKLVGAALILLLAVQDVAPRRHWHWTGDNAAELFGRSVSGANDVNGDGFGDLVVGLPGAKDGRGVVRVHSGHDGKLLHEFSGTDMGDQFGSSVSDAGDVNSDSFYDIIVGAPGVGNETGKVFVYSGSDGELLLTLEGEQEGERFGHSVSGAGDVDNDSFDDIVIGAPHWANKKKQHAGRFLVYSMRERETAFEIEAKQADELLGWSVAGAGDFNGDSFEDVIVGAPGAGRKRNKSPGMAYVYHGKKGSALYELEGEADGDRFGWSVHGAGDTNADGAGDVIIGCFAPVGYAKLVAGRKEEVVETFRGETEGEYFGATVGGNEANSRGRGTFDFDSDGFDDVLVGAPGDPGDVDAPERPLPAVRVFSGKTGMLLTKVEGTSVADHTGCSLAAANDVDNDGFGDFIVGDDQFGLRPGSATVYLGTSATKRQQNR